MTSGTDCPFCRLDPDRVVESSDLAVAVRDLYPVSPGHTLIIPKRHIPQWWDATPAERVAVLHLLDQAKAQLDEQFHPDGYNIGINNGEAAGQTVFHLHVHLIPRYPGDLDDPRGGVRHVVPAKARDMLDRR